VKERFERTEFLSGLFKSEQKMSEFPFCRDRLKGSKSSKARTGKIFWC